MNSANRVPVLSNRGFLCLYTVSHAVADLTACFLAAILAALLFAFVVLPPRNDPGVCDCAALSAAFGGAFGASPATASSETLPSVIPVPAF